MTPTTAIDAETMTGEQASAAADAWDFPMTEEWFKKQAAKEGDLEIGAGVTYVPPFMPSEADRYYGSVMDKLYGRIAELEHIAAHFQKLARVNAEADHALDTARREWEAKKGRD